MLSTVAGGTIASILLVLQTAQLATSLPVAGGLGTNAISCTYARFAEGFELNGRLQHPTALVSALLSDDSFRAVNELPDKVLPDMVSSDHQHNDQVHHGLYASASRGGEAGYFIVGWKDGNTGVWTVCGGGYFFWTAQDDTKRFTSNCQLVDRP